MDLRDKLVVRPDKRITLADWDPGETLGLDKEAAAEKTEQNIARLDELQYLMYAEHRRALLVVLQGMDGAGKDGTIRHVMSGLNPQGCRVTSSKRRPRRKRTMTFCGGCTAPCRHREKWPSSTGHTTRMCLRHECGSWCRKTCGPGATTTSTGSSSS